MRYKQIVPGRFIDRPNRFIANVETDTGPQVVHVKNTGRCRELLVPDALVYLEDHGPEHPERKTRYDLIAVKKGARLINMDAQAPNRVFAEWAQREKFHGMTRLRPETVWGNSRFDFYWESGSDHGFVEVKGVTLESDGYAKFPDAPTVRGAKHLEELILAKSQGYQADIVFILQMDGMRCFSPNDDTDPDFGKALRRAGKSGVSVLAFGCKVSPDALNINGKVSVQL